MQNLNYELDEKVAEVMKINMKEADKLKERGKLTARERINMIIDRGSPFLEIG
jgi:acetyl-CoA carboxylase carboxyltransferase component